MTVPRTDIKEVQRRIRDRYIEDPDSSVITLGVRGGHADLADPLHCDVEPTSVPEVTWRSGAHAAVGGEGDAPCSGDLLLGALAACQEITLRMVAANMGIDLEGRSPWAGSSPSGSRRSAVERG